MLPSGSVATMAIVPAPASGIRANEPSKTPNPSKAGDNQIPIASDPSVRESGSGVSYPPSSDPKYADSKNTDAKSPAAKDSDTDDLSSSNADRQDFRPSIPNPENTATRSSSAKPPKGDTLDPEYANLPSSNSQNIDSQVLGEDDKPEKAQGSSPKPPHSGESKADDANTDPSQPEIPDSPSNIADSGDESSETLPSDDGTLRPSNSNGNDVPISDLHGEDATDTSKLGPNLSNGKSKVASSNEKAPEILSSNKSPSAKPDTNKGGTPNAKATHDELDLFNILLGELPNVDGALSPSANSGGEQHSKLEDTKGDPSSQSKQLEYPPSRDDGNDKDVTAKVALSLQHLTMVLPTASSATIADLPIKTTPADDLTHSQSTRDLPTTSSTSKEDLPSSNGPTENSASAVVPAGTPATSTVSLSSADAAAASLRPDSEGTSSRQDQEENGGEPTSSKVKSSGNRLLPTRRCPENALFSSVRDLVYSVCTDLLPWLIIFL